MNSTWSKSKGLLLAGGILGLTGPLAAQSTPESENEDVVTLYISGLSLEEIVFRRDGKVVLKLSIDAEGRVTEAEVVVRA